MDTYTTTDRALIQAGLATPTELAEGQPECAMAPSYEDEQAQQAILAGHYHGNMERLAHELAWNRRMRREVEDALAASRREGRKLRHVLQWLAENPSSRQRGAVIAAAAEQLLDGPQA